MSKRLEDFVKGNREQFDDLEPSADMWARIEKHLPAQFEEPKKRETKTFTLGFVLRVAAAVIIVMGIGFASYLRSQKKQTIDLAAINPVYAQQQVQYTSLIESKRTELKSMAQSDPQLYKQFSADIAKMDSTYKKLNSELPTSPNQEQVLEAMIKNLQIQTKVLNQQLNVIEQFNKMKKEQKNEIKDI
jgi:anti-sigma-K factor RskA